MAFSPQVTYNALLKVCERGREWEWAAEVFDDMTAAGFKGNTVTFTALMTAAVQSGMWQVRGAC